MREHIPQNDYKAYMRSKAWERLKARIESGELIDLPKWKPATDSRERHTRPVWVGIDWGSF